ncbi:MAG: hypothetical protein JWO15_1432 [Sphingomonadales bacterium]|nr:hypothetical protein [Sphingomonadales bacterium]
MRKIIFVMAMAVGTVAQAQDAPRPMMSPACHTEMQNLCPATDDREARRSCMMAKRDSLSPKCKDEMAAMRKAREARGSGEGRPSHEGMGGMGGMGDGGMGGDHGGDQGGSPQ